MNKYVFISYSNFDRHTVRKITAVFDQASIPYWVDYNDVSAADNWSPALVEAIENCAVFLLVLTSNSNLSKTVLRELHTADNCNKPLYCLQLEALDMSKGLQLFFSAIHRFEAFTIPLARAMEKVVKDMHLQLKNVSGTKPKDEWVAINHLAKGKELFLSNDHENAFLHFKKAEEPEACYYLGRYYFLGVEPGFLDHEIARDYFSRMISAGHPLGYYGQGLIASYKRSGMHEAEIFFKKALEYIFMRAQEGDFLTCLMMGNYYRFGDMGIAQDMDKALSWYLRSAEMGFSPAQKSVGDIYLGRNDFRQALVWYRKAAEKQDSAALSQLGRLYEFGQGVEKDLKAAFEFYVKAAKLNDGYGLSNLGEFYLWGRYVNKDVATALAYYRRAEKLKNIDALKMIGALYLDGDVLPKNERLGVAYFEEVYELGSDDAAGWLRDFFEGKGDRVQAEKWKRLAPAATVGK